MSNVNKPVIPAEVADVIERLRNHNGYQNDFITGLALRTGGGLHNDTITLKKIPFDTLLAALVNGYERELTEEQRGYAGLKQAFLSGRGSNNWYHEGYADGIRTTLNTIGIKIEGVNA